MKLGNHKRYTRTGQFFHYSYKTMTIKAKFNGGFGSKPEIHIKLLIDA